MALCSNVSFGTHIPWCFCWRTTWISWNSQRQLPHLDSCLQSVVAKEIKLSILPRTRKPSGWQRQGAVTSNMQQPLVYLLRLHRRTPFPLAQGFSVHLMYIQKNMELENIVKICPLKPYLKNQFFFLKRFQSLPFNIKYSMKNSEGFITKYAVY